MWIYIGEGGSVWVCLTDDNPTEVGESFIIGSGRTAIDDAIKTLETAALMLRHVDRSSAIGYHMEVITE